MKTIRFILISILVVSLVALLVGLPYSLAIQGRFSTTDLFTLLNTVLSWPVATIVVAVLFIFRFRSSIDELLSNIASMRFPGGIEIQSHVQAPASDVDEIEESNISIPESDLKEMDSSIVPLDESEGISKEELQMIQNEYRHKVEECKLWKFQYLNLFFVQQTKNVLNWFSKSAPRTRQQYNLIWAPYIPNQEQRKVILEVLIQNGMLEESNGIIRITQEGHSFLQFTGYIPVPPRQKSPNPA